MCSLKQRSEWKSYRIEIKKYVFCLKEHKKHVQKIFECKFSIEWSIYGTDGYMLTDVDNLQIIQMPKTVNEITSLSGRQIASLRLPI